MSVTTPFFYFYSCYLRVCKFQLFSTSLGRTIGHFLSLKWQGRAMRLFLRKGNLNTNHTYYSREICAVLLDHYTRQTHAYTALFTLWKTQDSRHRSPIWTWSLKILYSPLLHFISKYSTTSATQRIYLYPTLVDLSNAVRKIPTYQWIKYQLCEWVIHGATKMVEGNSPRSHPSCIHVHSHTQMRTHFFTLLYWQMKKTLSVLYSRLHFNT